MHVHQPLNTGKRSTLEERTTHRALSPTMCKAATPDHSKATRTRATIPPLERWSALETPRRCTLETEMLRRLVSLRGPHALCSQLFATKRFDGANR